MRTLDSFRHRFVMSTLALAFASNACTGSPSADAAVDARANDAHADATPGDASFDASAPGVVISSALVLDTLTIARGGTIHGTVTYRNNGPDASTLQAVVIAARPPGGTHNGGPYHDLSPRLASTPLAVGETTTLAASVDITSSDPLGTWEAYATYQDADGAWHDGPSLFFTVTDGTTTGDAGTDASDGGSSRTPCWPFDQPPIATLRSSAHMVFAHYFSPFPLSLDNQPPATDYYARNYLQPGGESGAHAYCGGFLRERPYSPDPWPAGVDWQEQNMEIEVRRAVAIGLDGFTYDVLNVSPTNAHRVRLDKLLAAIPHVDPTFKIQLVLDMTALGNDDATALANIQTLFAGVGSDPSLQHTSDGRIVVSAFAAERRSAAFWNNALTTLASMGYRIAFIPMTVGGWAGNVSHFAGVPLYGASSWGSRTVSGAAGLRTAGDAPHAAGLVWMGPVAPQDSRPKDLTYTECDNSQAFRAQWESTIAGSADWVQLVTWGDYSEDSEIEPSSQTHTAFYDLSAYYIAWFKTGTQPAIARDAIYYFHRTQDMNAAPDLTMQRSAFRAVNGPTTSSNFIEVVGLLTAPGTLEIEIAGQTTRMDVGAGIQSFRIPLVEGTPVFRLVRNGATVVSLTSTSPISNTVTFQDPLYHAGASMTCAQ